MLPKKATTVDMYVGRQIRKRRLDKKMTLSQLAEKINLTFQQIQKYEAGTNKVSTSILWEISVALDVKISFFFKEIRRTKMPPYTEGDILIEIYNGLDKERRDLLKDIVYFYAGHLPSGE